MTEFEYRNGNRIAITYFLQFFTAVLAIAAGCFAWYDIKNNNFGSARLQIVMMAINAGLFIFQAHIRKTINARATRR